MIQGMRIADRTREMVLTVGSSHPTALVYLSTTFHSVLYIQVKKSIIAQLVWLCG